MRNSRLLASTAALFLLAGTAMAAETPATSVNGNAASTCKASPPTTWSGWGLDPYARSESEAYSDKKIDGALKDAVDAGCMPQVVADKLKEAVRQSPKGTTPDQLPTYLPPGIHIDMMETGHHGPMFNVTVGRIASGKGAVKAAEARVWAVEYDGKRYVLLLPMPCFNWSVLTQFTTAPLAKPGCAEILVPAKGGEAVMYAKYNESKPSECDALKGPADTDWRVMPTQCPDGPCRPPKTINGYTIFQNGGWRVKGKGGIYRVRVSKEFALHGVLELCLRNAAGQNSCGLKVQWDDYQQNVAVVHYSKPAAVQAAAQKPVVRLLYWKFDGNCLEPKEK